MPRRMFNRQPDTHAQAVSEIVQRFPSITEIQAIRIVDEVQKQDLMPISFPCCERQA